MMLYAGKRKRKQNHAGTTMVEMIVTFALLSLFMVAASRVISYTTTIYYQAKGSATGLEVSTMLSNKMIGMIEGAVGSPEVVKDAYTASDSIRFTDATESVVTISAQPLADSEGRQTGPYLTIHYDPAQKGAISYEETDFRYDPKAYLGYVLTNLRFQDPGEDYPDNVVKMEMTLHSEKYGDFTSVYYIKAVQSTQVQFH